MTFFIRHLLYNGMALPFIVSFANFVIFRSVGHFDLSSAFLPVLDLAMCFSDNLIFDMTNRFGFRYGLH